MNADLNRILTTREPFGPGDTESLVDAGLAGAALLFDRSNLIYKQTASPCRPTYIVGRKGAGKTAFLLGSTLSGGPPTEILKTSTVYHEMATVLIRYAKTRGPLFVDQAAEIWLALFEQVALLHACRTASTDDPPNELQVLWDYLGSPSGRPADATAMVERFLSDVQQRIGDESVIGLRDIIFGPPRAGITFDRAREAVRKVLASRPQPLIIVMDNLEDLHARLHDLRDMLAGLFRCTGSVIARNSDDRPFGLQICLPSEMFEQIHEISTAPEKDFRNSYLTIYWTARELLKLAGTRLELFFETHYPEKLEYLLKRAIRVEEPDPAIALLRAALPPRMRSGLGIEEDPLAYVLRHTQLLPRHLIEILNSVFSSRHAGSQPWEVTPQAVLAGTRKAELMVVNGILAAHQASYPFAREALRRLSDQLDICFPAKELRKVFNQQGIRKLTGWSDFDEFLSMLLSLGVVGVQFDETARYNKAHFQYTFDSSITSKEDTDHLCFHPLFTRYLHERSLPRMRGTQTRSTYPHGCDPSEEDYRISLGYSSRSKRS